MQKLNLPEYNFKLRSKDKKIEILDKIRKKYVSLTPEEWVRQNFIMYLIKEKKVPESLIAIESSMRYNNMKKRSDIVIYKKNAKPIMIVECKAPEIKISQAVFDQIARYNMVLKVNYLIVTNGLQHYCCAIDYLNKTYSFLKEIPKYQIL